MATTIPYDPSLVLGNIVKQDALDNLKLIAAQQAPVDAAEDHYNALLATRRKLDMTNQELLDMGIDPPKDSKQALADLNNSIQAASDDYVKKQIAAETAIQPLREKMTGISQDVESPIDYVRTEIKSMPISSDSLKMDAQYFSYDSESQTAQSQASIIAGYVEESTSFLGDDLSSAMKGSVQTQAETQYENHSIAGTLVLTAGCTHKNAALLAPFILDVDKAIRVWNTVYTAEEDKIKTDSIANLQSIAAQEGTNAEKFLQLISGATFGSSFVGMVHVLNTTETSSNQSMVSVAASMQEKFEVGGWFASESGTFGVDSSFTDDIKNLLSSQNITSHITIVTMGIIPSIVSNKVAIGVQQFADFDPAKIMGNLATFANATSGASTTVAKSAADAKTGAQMLAIQSSQVTNVMLGLGKIDDGSNQMLDINSMMTAFEDYIAKAIAGSAGVPINYYLKSISRAELAQMWVAKYYPNKYLSIAGDDTKPSNGGGGGTTPTPPEG
jgi:hypothetical protein